MHAILRISMLCLATTLAPAAAADGDLDERIRDHVLPRFDREARAMAADAGARLVSSRWDAATRTLIAVAELPASPPRRLSVAYPSAEPARLARLESQHLTRICAHPAAALIERFLEEHGIALTFVYTRPQARLEPLMVSLDHADLAACP